MLGPVARLLVKLGVSPDLVTIIGTLGVALGALICFPQGWLWQGVVVVTIFVISDMIDGLMAKITGTSSNWGAFLDSTSDRLGDAAVFGGSCSTSSTARTRPSGPVSPWLAWSSVNGRPMSRPEPRASDSSVPAASPPGPTDW